MPNPAFFYSFHTHREERPQTFRYTYLTLQQGIGNGTVSHFILHRDLNTTIFLLVLGLVKIGVHCKYFCCTNTVAKLVNTVHIFVVQTLLQSLLFCIFKGFSIAIRPFYTSPDACVSSRMKNFVR